MSSARFDCYGMPVSQGPLPQFQPHTASTANSRSEFEQPPSYESIAHSAPRTHRATTTRASTSSTSTLLAPPTDPPRYPGTCLYFDDPNVSEAERAQRRLTARYMHVNYQRQVVRMEEAKVKAKVKEEKERKEYERKGAFARGWDKVKKGSRIKGKNGWVDGYEKGWVVGGLASAEGSGNGSGGSGSGRNGR